MFNISYFINTYINHLYGAIALLSFWYIYKYINATQKLRIGTYIVERDTAVHERMVALSGLIILGGCAIAIYLGVGSNWSAVQSSLLLENNVDEPLDLYMTNAPTDTPDVVLLLPGQATEEPSVQLGLENYSTPIPLGGDGCDNMNAVISSPLPGAVLSGEVEVQGTADIVDFGFYVLQISTLGDNWLTVYTQNTPVIDDILGTWDTSLYVQGEYGFRLIVYNNAGAFIKPCVIPIYVGSGQ